MKITKGHDSVVMLCRSCGYGFHRNHLSLSDSQNACGILAWQSDIAEWGGSFFVDDFFPDHHGYTTEPASTGLHFCDDFPAVRFWVITLNCIMVSTQHKQNKNCTFFKIILTKFKQDNKILYTWMIILSVTKKIMLCLN